MLVGGICMLSASLSALLNVFIVEVKDVSDAAIEFILAEHVQFVEIECL